MDIIVEIYKLPPFFSLRNCVGGYNHTYLIMDLFDTFKLSSSTTLDTKYCRHNLGVNVTPL